MSEKKLIIAARTLSIIFTPFYLPLVGMIILFWVSDLNQFRLAYRLNIVIMVYLFTVLLPTYFIRLYRNYNGWKAFQLGQKERRMVPYVISIMSYFICYYLMNYRHIPHVISSIIIAALLVQLVCAFINVWWKVSTHMAGIGGIVGGLIVFSIYFSFNMIWWLCFTLLLAGLVGSSRMILRQHNLSQVVVGFIIGLFLTSFSIIFL